MPSQPKSDQSFHETWQADFEIDMEIKKSQNNVRGNKMEELVLPEPF